MTSLILGKEWAETHVPCLKYKLGRHMEESSSLPRQTEGGAVDSESYAAPHFFFFPFPY